jgi:predicted PurR-regulated permease PerM
MLQIVDDTSPPSPDPSSSLVRRVLTAAEHQAIPLRTIVVAVAVVVVAGLALTLAWVLRTDLLMIGAATFIAVLLAQPVAWLERRGLRRSIATSIVFMSGLLVFAGVAYLLGSPLVSHVNGFLHDLPNQVQRAQQGKGPIGRIITRLHLHNWIEQNSPKLQEWAKHLAGPALTVGGAALSTLFRLVTIAVISFFLLLDLPRIWGGFLSLLPQDRSERVARVAHEASTGVTGYMAGNALTSIVAGIVVYVSLLVFGVPFASLLAVWVALVDFIPIVGALLAGVPTVLVAFLHSPTAGLGVLIIFLVYQQIENHVLNPIVMARTVKMSPLLNLLAVLIGATLGGRVGGAFGTLIGALVGIPVGSALQVIVREVRHPRDLESDGIDDLTPST